MKQVLLVEDSRYLRRINERALLRAGYQVAAPADEAKAIRLAMAENPDLVLLHMLLPKMGGPEGPRVLRRNPLTENIPIAILSSLPRSNEARLRKEGATAYIDKSALGLHQDSNSLIHIVQSLLGEVSQSSNEMSQPSSRVASSVKGAL